MLEAKDLEAIGTLLDEKLDAKLNPKFEKFGKELEERIDKKIEARAIKTESMLLDEIDRMKKHLDTKIDRLDKNVEEMKQYYRIERIDNQTITVMMRSIEELRQDVDELKERKEAVGA